MVMERVAPSSVMFTLIMLGTSSPKPEAKNES